MGFLHKDCNISVGIHNVLELGSLGQDTEGVGTLHPLAFDQQLHFEARDTYRGNGLPATNKTSLPITATGPFYPRSWAPVEMKPAGLGESSSFTQGYYVRSSGHLQRIEENSSNWVTKQVIYDQREDCFSRTNASPLIYTVTEGWNKRNMCFHAAKFCYL